VRLKTLKNGRRNVACVCLAVAAAASDPLGAQQATQMEPIVSDRVLEATTQAAPTRDLVLGSTIGWALGLALGAGAGYLIEPDSGERWGGALEWWQGAWVGSSIGAAAGAHIANRGRGNLVLGSLGAFAVVPIVVLAAVPLLDVGGVAFVPVAQIGTTVFIQRRTTKHDER
jgi:hypothetical protein